ncbi:phage holin family protein [Slackia piriformis]|nr:phage holin family protein [Slackia piriformis]
MKFILRWIVTALAVGVAVWIVPGISVFGMETWAAVALFGLVLALINMSIKPILQFISLPITCLTLGFFYLVVNAFLLYLAQWLANNILGLNFYIEGLLSALVGAIVISIVSAILNAITGANEE